MPYNPEGSDKMTDMVIDLAQSGYQPEYTIAFITFGSEGYGVADTVYDDWRIGAWPIALYFSK